MTRTTQTRLAVAAAVAFPLAAAATFATGQAMSGVLFLIAASFAVVTAYANTKRP